MKSIVLYLIYTVSLSLITSCASVPNKTSKANTNIEKGFPIHGNFCGPNTPSVSTNDMKHWSAQLKQKKPHDKLDKICKEHDICYTENGYHNLGCDKNLIKSISELDSKKYSVSCLALAAAMSGYFIATNPSGMELEKYVDNLVLNTAFQGAYNYTSAGAYFYKAYTSFAILVYSPVLLLIGGSPSEITELMGKPFNGDNKDFSGYPARYDVCGRL